MLYFYKREFTRVKDAFDFGMELGTIFWFTFYPQKENIEMLLDDDATYAQDYTWDENIK